MRPRLSWPRKWRPPEVSPRVSFTYFEIIDTCQRRGCPLCRLRAGFVQRSLGSLLYENVNDPDIRERLRRSLGWCAQHASLLPGADQSPALGVAIITQDLVHLCLSTLSNKHPERGLTPTDACPACQYEAEVEDLLGWNVAAHLDRRELREALQASDGICVPHVRAILPRLGDKEARSFLLSLTRQKLQALDDRLGMLIRHHDYRFNQDPMDEEERDSWMRALRMLSGIADPS